MKKLLLSVAVLAMVCGTADAQSFLERLGEKAKNAAEQNLGQKVEKGVNDVLDGKVGKKNKKNKEKGEEASEAASATAAWTCEECGKTGNTGKFCDDCGAPKPGAEAPKPKKQTASEYAKSDFVPGDEIFFEDTFENEQMGEFPAQWDLMSGYAEVGSVDGRKVIAFTDDGFAEIQPLMNDQQHFLPDVFTLEFDMYLQTGDGLGGDELEIAFGNPDLPNWNGRVEYVVVSFRDDGYSRYGWTVQKPNGGDDITGEKLLSLDESGTPLKDGWNHFAFSFNKRAFKGYVNGVRVMSVPTAKVPSHFWFNHGGQYKYACISNVRLAKGAVPLYDRLSSDGKIITYAITFETGKADLKPESMVEINRIAKLMQENPGIEFEVQGHCDATGSDKVNDPLSQKRAEAIVAALVEQGIAESRLTPVGKGSHVPIATNSTDEGRAKNRRVEFVKK
ncbi:MAG: OmpA family protein [Bacteroidales bacterium]|nr:OmpA family protein [Bacteroidales bacterium]